MMCMKRPLLLTVVVYIAAAWNPNQAVGADQQKSEFPQRISERWDRTYFGIQVGYAAGELEYPFLGSNVASETFSGAFEGVNFGVQGGQSWQNGALVLGIDLQFRREKLNGDPRGLYNYTEFRNDGPYQFRSVGAASIEVNWSAAAKTRIGIAKDSSLLYASIGATLAKVDELSEFFVFQTDPSNSTTVIFGAAHGTSSIQAGLITGVGFEYALSKNLSFATEYEYSWFGNRGFAPNEDETSLDWHTINVRLNWSF